jgi:gliding motility-associated-like protein
MLCSNSSISLTDLSSVNVPYSVIGWDWSISDGTTNNDSDWDYFPQGAGIFDITLTVTTSTGCHADTTISSAITVLPSPIANFEYEMSDASLNGLMFDFINLSFGAVSWEYSFGDGTIGISPDPTHEFPDYGEYTVGLVITNIYGCQAYHVEVIPADPFYNIYVPNAFTPDNDGINDGFLPAWSGFAMKAYHMQIFNRWGELIFESNDDKEPWIGDVSGGSYFAPDDVYNWRLTIHPAHLTDAIVVKGHVTLIR